MSKEQNELDEHLNALGSTPRRSQSDKPQATPQSQAKGAPTKVSRLVELLGDMTDDEVREASEKIGADLPLVPKGINPSVVAWAYKCGHCPTVDDPFKYAFEFVGDKFLGPNGDLMDRPPLGVPIERLPWTQNRGTRKSFTRSEPICQHCGNKVHLGPGGTIADTRMIDVVRHEREQAIIQEQRRKPMHRRQVMYNTAGRGGSTGEE